MDTFSRSRAEQPICERRLVSNRGLTRHSCALRPGRLLDREGRDRMMSPPVSMATGHRSPNVVSAEFTALQQTRRPRHNASVDAELRQQMLSYYNERAPESEQAYTPETGTAS